MVVESGLVLVGGAPTVKPARLVGVDEPLEVIGPPPPFVSRGGLKLSAAISSFGVKVAGRRALDAGASTGGFTDCLLQRGALHVVAVDVGRAQLHPRLVADPRVTMIEGCNVRDLGHALSDPLAGERFSLIVADLSFISLAAVVPALAGRLCKPGADLVLLVKPQFEASRREASRGRGVIRDPRIWHQALVKVASALLAEGADIMGAMVSPLKGAAGNTEFFIHARSYSRTPSVAHNQVPAAVLSMFTALVRTEEPVTKASAGDDLPPFQGHFFNSLPPASQGEQ
ncbi:MAG: TlyA family RNA methyltransferase [Actinobacteria bacterium]|nr:TlyA family RNA methyltransferase [Actinomycetota bacterium]